MRSGISFFDWTVFKKTIFRFWPLWGVYFTIWLVALPLNGLMVLRAENYDWYGGTMEYFSFYRVLRTVTNDTLPVFVVFGVLVAMAVFSHLYNARSANLFGSLPIRREGLFLTHYLAGLAFLTVPNIVIFLLTLAVEAAGGVMCAEGLLFWLAVACGEGFFFYSLAVFCAMFTGHILALPAFFIIVNFFVEALTALVVSVFQLFYYGFAGAPYWVETVVLWFTPTQRLYEAVNCWTVTVQGGPAITALSDERLVLKTEGLGTVGIYAIAALALVVCAFFLYRARRLESAGDVVAVSWMKPVFKYGVALCAGLALGIGTLAIIYGGEITLMIAIVVWGIVGYFAAEMLLQKSFKVFKKWKGAAAVTAVFIVLFLVVGFDLTGFETRVPDAGNVTSVEVSGLSGVYRLGDSGDRINMELTDPERIRDIIILHQEAVDQKDEEMLHGSETTYLSIKYHLRGGGTMSRSYNLHYNPGLVGREGSAAWAIQQLYDDRELCWRIYGFDRLEDYLADGGRLDWAEYEKHGKYDGMGENAMFYGNDASALLAAVKEDFFAGRIGVRRAAQNTEEKNGLDEYLSFSSDNKDNYGYHNIQIALSGTATSTRAALEEMADRAVRPNMPYDTDDWTIQDIITQ